MQAVAIHQLWAKKADAGVDLIRIPTSCQRPCAGADGKGGVYTVFGGSGVRQEAFGKMRPQQEDHS